MVFIGNVWHGRLGHARTSNIVREGHQDPDDSEPHGAAAGGSSSVLLAASRMNSAFGGQSSISSLSSPGGVTSASSPPLHSQHSLSHSPGGANSSTSLLSTGGGGRKLLIGGRGSSSAAQHTGAPAPTFGGAGDGPSQHLHLAPTRRKSTPPPGASMGVVPSASSPGGLAGFGLEPDASVASIDEDGGSVSFKNPMYDEELLLMYLCIM